jgi:hypothetical protein
VVVVLGNIGHRSPAFRTGSSTPRPHTWSVPQIAAAVTREIVRVASEAFGRKAYRSRSSLTPFKGQRATAAERGFHALEHVVSTPARQVELGLVAPAVSARSPGYRKRLAGRPERDRMPYSSRTMRAPRRCGAFHLHQGSQHSCRVGWGRSPRQLLLSRPDLGCDVRT